MKSSCDPSSASPFSRESRSQVSSEDSLPGRREKQSEDFSPTFPHMAGFLWPWVYQKSVDEFMGRGKGQGHGKPRGQRRLSPLALWERGMGACSNGLWQPQRMRSGEIHFAPTVLWYTFWPSLSSHSGPGVLKLGRNALGRGATAAHRTLDPLILVRIQAPQPENPLWPGRPRTTWSCVGSVCVLAPIPLDGEA